jgi:DNA-binding response OmpR family regulator
MLSNRVSELRGKKILVIDDDPDMLAMVQLFFSRAEAWVCTATDGQTGLRQFYAQQPDLVLLDLMMPEMDGWQVCRRIRGLSDVPIIILTALGHEDHIIRGLNDGADDYVTKPFSPDVLVARTCAALRRRASPTNGNVPVCYDDGCLVIDLERRRVSVLGKPVKLSRTEYRLLTYLFKNAGRVCTFQQILENVWEDVYGNRNESVHVYMSHLRHKLEVDPKRPRYFLSERGVGYCFER